MYSVFLGDSTLIKAHQFLHSTLEITENYTGKYESVHTVSSTIFVDKFNVYSDDEHLQLNVPNETNGVPPLLHLNLVSA